MEDQLQCMEFTVTEDMEEERIDKLLSSLMDSFSRSYIQKLLTGGNLLINDKTIDKASYKVKAEDEVKLFVPPAEQLNIEPEDIPLDVLYEDEDLIVVNKPKGMVVHPAPGHYTGTLVNALLYHCKGQLSGINGISEIFCRNSFLRSTIFLMQASRYCKEKGFSINASAPQFIPSILELTSVFAVNKIKGMWLIV